MSINNLVEKLSLQFDQIINDYAENKHIVIFFGHLKTLLHSDLQQVLKVIEEVSKLFINEEAFIDTYVLYSVMEKYLPKHEPLLRYFTFNSENKTNTEDNYICSICLSDIGDGDQCADILCKSKHPFHLSCLKTWCSYGSNNNNCPLCKVMLYEKNENILR